MNFPALTHKDDIFVVQSLYKNGISCFTVTFYFISTQKENISKDILSAHGKYMQGKLMGDPCSVRPEPTPPSTGSKHSASHQAFPLQSAGQLAPSQAEQQLPSGFAGFNLLELPVSSHTRSFMIYIEVLSDRILHSGRFLILMLSGSSCSLSSGQGKGFCQISLSICICF